MAKINYICPFCFEKQKITDVEFRCVNVKMKNDSGISERRCPNTPDQKLTDFLGLKETTERPNTFRAKASGLTMPQKANCDVCGELSTVRICPNCHSRLPNDIDNADDIIFAVIGAKEAGKSHYIAVLIHTIKTMLSVDFNFAMQAATEETIRRYNADFSDQIYKKGEIILSTNSGVSNSTVREPLIYILKFEVKTLFSKKLKTVTLVFFDTAGEDLNDGDTMMTVNKYIYNSAGIIFLLDPLQLTSVRENLPQGTPLPTVNTEIASIITRTTNLIRKGKGIDSSSKINIPLAVAFTKIDALEPIIDPSSCLNYPSAHKGKFNENDFKAVSKEMETILRSWDENDFAQQISLNYTNFAYFGLSSLGSTPKNQKIEKVISRRVEDPFLWLLWKHGIIK